MNKRAIIFPIFLGMLFAAYTAILGISRQEQLLLEEIAFSGFSEVVANRLRAQNDQMCRYAATGDKSALESALKTYEKTIHSFKVDRGMTDDEVWSRAARLLESDQDGKRVDKPILVAARNGQLKTMLFIVKLHKGKTLTTNEDIFKVRGVGGRTIFHNAASAQQNSKTMFRICNRLIGKKYKVPAEELVKNLGDKKIKVEDITGAIFAKCLSEKDSAGNIALNYEITERKGNEGDVQYLVEKGSNLSLKNNDGLKPLDIARAKGTGIISKKYEIIEKAQQDSPAGYYEKHRKIINKVKRFTKKTKKTLSPNVKKLVATLTD